MKKVVVVLSIFVLMASTYAFSASGPILYFTFDAAQGAVVKDMSGGGHDGTLKEGAAIVTNPKKIGAGALQIKGGNQSMEVANFAKLETYTDNTYAFWILFTDPASGGWDQIVVHPGPNASDRSPGLWVTPEGLSIHYRYNPGNAGFWGITQTGNQDAKFFELNKWYHITGVTAKAELVAFVNGKEVAKIAVPAKFDQGPIKDMAGLYVGKSKSYGGPAAKFVIDDLAIYDRALSKDEILSIQGGLTPVDSKDKLAFTWGKAKYNE